MSKRIRYVATKKPNIMKSMRNYQGQQGALYQAIINIEEMTYKILNVRQRLIIRSTELDNIKPPKNKYTLQEQVRRALKSVGVKFDSEFRGLK